MIEELKEFDFCNKDKKLFKNEKQFISKINEIINEINYITKNPTQNEFEREYIRQKHKPFFFSNLPAKHDKQDGWNEKDCYICQYFNSDECKECKNYSKFKLLEKPKKLLKEIDKLYKKIDELQRKNNNQYIKIKQLEEQNQKLIKYFEENK